MKYWEIIADNLSKAGWSWGCVSAIDSEGQTIWIANAHRGNGKRFVVRADEKLSDGRSYILSVLFVISRVNYFFSEGAVPPGTAPSNFRISPFRPTAQPW